MKLLRILRGLPGSGKSYLAKKMSEEEGAIVLNNDDLLVTDGAYKWDEELVLIAHHYNQKRATNAMRENVPLIVLDNTNLLPYHSSPYVRLANFYGYEHQVIPINTPWAFDLDELTKRNIHNVPKSILECMKKILDELPLEALKVILNYEMEMDPEIVLRNAQIFTETGNFAKADECIMDYEDWYRIGGYEPDGGQEVASSINDKLWDWKRSLD